MNTGDDDVIVCFDIKVRTDTGRERGQILLTQEAQLLLW